MSLENSEKSELAMLVFYLVIALAALIITYVFVNKDTAVIVAVWLLGAAALGMASGFVAGAATQPGAAVQLLGLFGTGVIVPILGGVAALLKQPEAATGTTTPDQMAELHPLWIAGSFFATFSFFVVIGIAIGVRRRNGTVLTKPGGINLV